MKKWKKSIALLQFRNDTYLFKIFWCLLLEIHYCIFSHLCRFSRNWGHLVQSACSPLFHGLITVNIFICSYSFYLMPLCHLSLHPTELVNRLPPQRRRVISLDAKWNRRHGVVSPSLGRGKCCYLSCLTSRLRLMFLKNVHPGKDPDMSSFPLHPSQCAVFSPAPPCFVRLCSRPALGPRPTSSTAAPVPNTCGVAKVTNARKTLLTLNYRFSLHHSYFGITNQTPVISDTCVWWKSMTGTCQMLEDVKPEELRQPVRVGEEVSRPRWEPLWNGLSETHG